MPALIPVPKTYEKTADGVHFVPFNFFLSEEKWRENADVFCAAFKKGHANALTDGKKGGIEVYFDASVAENAYRIETTDGPLCLYASAVEGLMYGFATALQLCTMADSAIRLPSVKIEDYPDKDYRSIMVDIGREWHPLDKLLRFVDLCFLYKVRYLNLHFADNKLYTLPSKAFPKLNVEGKYYTEEDIAALRKYAKARGVVLVPEFECPGHAPILNTYYPEVFRDRSEGQEAGVFLNEQGEPIPSNALICAGSERAVNGVKTLLAEIAELFPEAPYIHIGGDEAQIYLWKQCADCRAYMEKNGIEDVYGLFSDYIARIANYVLSLGKTPIVWEGFPEKGNEKIPRETLVISWENHYQTTEQLLAEGFQLINASWKPLYIIPSLCMPGGDVYWTAKDIYDWNVYNWQHWWPQSSATLNPVNIQPTEQLIGAMLCAWEMTYDQEISMIMAHLPAMADRTWSVRTVRSYAEYKEAFRPIHDLTARIMQDL
jgi:hexosaminidase